MIRIPVPEIAYSTIEVSMGGESYSLTFRFNERMGRWKLDISQSDGTPVANGLTLIEGTVPTGHLTLDNLNGNLFVAKTESTSEKAGRDNLGIDKAYELIYIDNSEIQ